MSGSVSSLTTTTTTTTATTTGYFRSVIESRIRAFDCNRNQRPWISPNGNNALCFRLRVFQSLPRQESRAVARKPRDTAAVLYDLKFADDTQYKFKSCQASKARLRSSKHTGAKQNLTQNGHLRSFRIMCFGVSGTAIRD